jgi:hypothetical protein
MNSGLNQQQTTGEIEASNFAEMVADGDARSVWTKKATGSEHSAACITSSGSAIN